MLHSSVDFCALLEGSITAIQFISFYFLSNCNAISLSAQPLMSHLLFLIDYIEKANLKFYIRGNVVDMAIGIIIGSAFSHIVTSLVNDIS